MITALEARSLVEASDVSIKTMLDKLSVQIADRAASGIHSLVIYDDGWWESIEEYRATFAQPSAKQTRLMSAICGFGYMVRFGRVGDAYVPRAFEDDASEPKYVNMAITISW